MFLTWNLWGTWSRIFNGTCVLQMQIDLATTTTPWLCQRRHRARVSQDLQHSDTYQSLRKKIQWGDSIIYWGSLRASSVRFIQQQPCWRNPVCHGKLETTHPWTSLKTIFQGISHIRWLRWHFWFILTCLTIVSRDKYHEVHNLIHFKKVRFWVIRIVWISFVQKMWDWIITMCTRTFRAQRGWWRVVESLPNKPPPPKKKR